MPLMMMWDMRGARLISLVFWHVDDLIHSFHQNISFIPANFKAADHSSSSYLVFFIVTIWLLRTRREAVVVRLVGRTRVAIRTGTRLQIARCVRPGLRFIYGSLRA